MKPYSDLNERITRNIIHDSNKIIQDVLEFELYDKVLNTAYQNGLLQFNDHGVTITFED